MSVTEDIREIFEKMPAAFRAEKAANTRATIQLELSGEGGGNWVIKIANGQVAVEEGKAAAPDLTLGMAASDYVAISYGTLNPMNAFMAKKISLQGNMTLAMKFPDLFDRDQA